MCMCMNIGMCCDYWCIVMLVVLLVFFFKQKTAYEMRISDWSSDVCSSDLADAAAGRRKNRIVDADNPAIHVEHGTARIAAVDRSVGLQVAVISPAGAGVAVDSRDDTRGHRASQPERIADGDHPISDSSIA